MTDITIPPEAVRAAKIAWANNGGPTSDDDMAASIAAALRAGITAWPGLREHKVQVPDDSDEIRYTLKTTGIILPLQQENTNEKV